MAGFRASLHLYRGGALELDSGAVLSAEVRAVEIERGLEFDWAAPGEEPSVVRFELRPDGEGAILAVDHRLIDARAGMRVMRLWEAHLARLDVHLGEAEER